MADKKTTKIVTKKHLARLERERRQVRIIMIVSIVILASVFLSIAYGILNETVLKNFKPVVSVNGESVSIREFEFAWKDCPSTIDRPIHAVLQPGLDVWNGSQY